MTTEDLFSEVPQRIGFRLLIVTVLAKMIPRAKLTITKYHSLSTLRQNDAAMS